jgi:hypothetical protein
MSDRTHRTTWTDSDDVAWRVERIEGRWQLSYWSPAAEEWCRHGSYPSRAAAIRAAYGDTEGDDR